MDFSMNSQEVMKLQSMKEEIERGEERSLLMPALIPLDSVPAEPKPEYSESCETIEKYESNDEGENIETEKHELSDLNELAADPDYSVPGPGDDCHNHRISTGDNKIKAKRKEAKEGGKRRGRKSKAKKPKEDPVDSALVNDLLLFEANFDVPNYTLDNFDTNIGVLRNNEAPSSVEFACALLREVLVALSEPSVLREKVKLGALILHLSTAVQEFDWLYQYFHQIETDVLESSIDWCSYQEGLEIERNILSQAREGNCVYDPYNLSYKGLPPPPDMVLKVEDDPSNNTYDDNEDDFYNDADFNPEDNEKAFIKKKRGRPKGVGNGAGGTVKTPKKKKVKSENADTLPDSEDNSGTTKKPRGRKKNMDRPYLRICELCKFAASGDKGLDIHMFEEHSHGSLCTQCGHPSETYKEYEKHMSTHILNCDLCDYSGVGLNRLRRHQNTHKTLQKYGTFVKIPCHICGREIQENCLANHITNSHPNAEANFKCDQCGFVTHTEKYLQDHKRRHKNTTKKCPVCNRSVKYLNNHLQRGNCFKTEGTFPCDMCGKVFKDAYKVKRHVKQIHMKIKDFICDMCDYRTYTAFNLKIHKAKMHTKESLEVFCEICNKKTMSIEHHKKTYHIEVYTKELHSNKANNMIDVVTERPEEKFHLLGNQY